MSRNRLIRCLFALLVLGVVALPENAQGEDKPAELKVLERFVGEWETVALSKPSLLAPKEFSTKGTMTREWVLDGRFVQENRTGRTC